MAVDKSKSTPNRFVLLTYTVIITVILALLTLVVIMLVTGTLHILGRDVISETLLKAASMVSAICIAGISLFIFVRNFKRIYNHLEQILSRTGSAK